MTLFSHPVCHLEIFLIFFLTFSNNCNDTHWDSDGIYNRICYFNLFIILAALHRTLYSLKILINFSQSSNALFFFLSFIPSIILIIHSLDPCSTKEKQKAISQSYPDYIYLFTEIIRFTNMFVCLLCYD